MKNMNEDEFIVNNSNYRKIVVNGVQFSNYPTNAISTTKYNFVSFLPLFLFEQFHNYTNCFFLLISIIQQFPEASSLGPYTTLIPLSIILCISAIKEILEDIHRYKDDKKVNRKPTEVFRDFRWSSVEWSDIQVGDFVKIHNNEFFPADLLFLKSSNEGNICYIETVNLDGENNLKIRQSVSGVNADCIMEMNGVIECDPPNELIYNFNGIFRVKDSLTIPLIPENVLLRGAVLRNTDWIVGLAIYTGSETKIMKNSSGTRLKRSSVSVMVNSQIIIIFIFFLSFTLFHWVFFLIWNNNNYKNTWYLPISHQDLLDGSTIIICLVFGIIYSIMIPISLQVMQELSRFVQGIFISNDLDMYYEQSDTPAIVKTSSLNEDLALVKYIFADKTGTLTQNILEFKCCSIQGKIYDNNLIRKWKTKKLNVTSAIHHFFIAICTSPGVIPIKTDDMVSYNVSSPDQKALILAAHEFGYSLLNRTHNCVEIIVNNKLLRYKVLCDFEFSSDRKRSSVIVKNPNNELILYAIGADDVILPRCIPIDNYRDVTKKHIEEFTSQGLRSICISMVKIAQREFENWYPLFVKARESLTSKDNLTEKAEHAIVKNLQLLGCTGVEDKLQNDVPETIDALLEAGINIWILTGDKQETAINIGYACRLLSDELPIIILNSVNLGILRHSINRYKNEMGEYFGKPGNNYGLVVTGDSLNILLESKNDVFLFLNLMLSCRAVICCRTTPKQKALIVKNVQKYTNFVTLAIGDGANDVAMIQTASIGIGISGKEGMQAANAADYSLAQFKYLKKLLLVHGTWNYDRICKMIYFIYYKNVVIATIQFCYTATNAWSGQLCLDRWAKMLYNVLLTSAPTLALGIFEKNFSSNILLNNPYIYTKNKWFNMKSFSICLFNAFVHSILLSWLSLGVFNSSVFWFSGRNEEYMFVGNIVYTSLISIICLKSGLHTYHWTNVTVLFLIITELSWIIVLTCLSHTWPLLYIGEDMPRMVEILFTTPLFWLFMLFIIVSILSLDLVIITLYRTFREPMISSLRNISVGGTNRLETYG
ncbi:hypothetical protein PGB90_002654 [Kerria lacca]